MGHTPRDNVLAMTTTVHPHARGAYAVRVVSPGHWPRFIPTHVGHTSSFTFLISSISVHPHARGAYSCPRLIRFLTNGSSPRTWGIHSPFGGYRGYYSVHPHARGAYTTLASCGEHPLRFIPTHVGHTPVFVVPVVQNPVHPHARGAYLAIGLTSVHSSGSSPRTWGILTVAE